MYGQLLIHRVLVLALLKATLFSFRITFHASTGAAQLSAAIPDHLLRA